MELSLEKQLDSLGPGPLRKLLDVNMILSSTSDLRQLLDIVIKVAADLVNTEYASLILLDQGTGKLYIGAATDLDLVADGAVFLREDSVAGQIVATEQPLMVNDVAESGRIIPETEDTLHIEINNILGVPIKRKGVLIGVLQVINKQDNQDFGERDVALTRTLASMSAVAIENARLFQKTDLISEFVHEFKTPLMALTAAGELLARGKLPKKQHEFIEMIQSETMRLSKMAQDFLDLARLESGRMRVIREPVSIPKLVNDVIRLQRSQAQKRQIEITSDLPSGFPVVFGEYDRLKQVLLNLTSNAIKYNFQGGSVSIGVRNEDQEVIIEITDTGRGIAPENLDHLFERFYRIPDSEGFTQGSGLGLSIASRIIKEHGGRIEVESEPGEGSTFCCYLPLGGL